MQIYYLLLNITIEEAPVDCSIGVLEKPRTFPYLPYVFTIVLLKSVNLLGKYKYMFHYFLACAMV